MTEFEIVVVAVKVAVILDSYNTNRIPEVVTVFVRLLMLQLTRYLITLAEANASQIRILCFMAVTYPKFRFRMDVF